LLAGLSPLALLTTLAAFGSRHGRANGIAFAAAFVLAQSIVLLIAVLLGTAVSPDRDRDHDSLAAVLELVLGIAVLALAGRARRALARSRPDAPSRTRAVLERLRGLRLATALAAGLLLGVGGVKRLTITLVTGATIALAPLSEGEEATWGIVYVAIATVLVWVPALVYFVAGRRADALAERTENWVIANEHRVTTLTLAVVGLLLTADALVHLLA
jgi:Sap, sulfolipid-1-addressing protein